MLSYIFSCLLWLLGFLLFAWDIWINIDQHDTSNLRNLVFIKAPMHHGQIHKGVRKAPDQILESNQFLHSNKWDSVKVIDKLHAQYDQPHDTQEIFNVLNMNEVASFNGELHMQVYEACSKNSNFVITVGGDHSLAIGSVTGMLRHYRDLGVIWVDAHADIHTPDTSPSGNMHGCPISFLLGLQRSRDLMASSPSWSWLHLLARESIDQFFLKPQNMVYIGLRDVELAERRYLQTLGILAFSMHEIEELGIAEVLNLSLRHLNGKAIHLSFDIDSIDPLLAPSTGTPVPAGLTEREGLYICRRLAASKRLVSMDLVEVNLELGSNPTETVRIARAVIGAATGDTLL